MPSLNPAIPKTEPNTQNLAQPGTQQDAQQGTRPGAQSGTQKGQQSRRTVRQILLSYFYWTYSRGSFHYDVMVTLILLFIFVTPQIPGWSFGDKPSPVGGPLHAIQVIGNDGQGLIVTVQAADVNLDLRTSAPNAEVKKVLRKAIETVTGDDVYVEHWETATDAEGHPVWKVWAHR